jgi:hypothetical protein
MFLSFLFLERIYYFKRIYNKIKIKMDNTQLLIFKAITGLISDLDQEFGKRHKSIALYNRLLEKTGIIHVAPINKHIDCFRSFFNTNQRGMEEKNSDMFVESKISYSDRVYVDVGTVLRQSSKENAQIIWKHLLTIWGLIDSTSPARKLLQESFGSSNTEEDFLTNIIDRVEKTVGSGSVPTDNPMAAISNLMQSGVMTDLVSGMQKGLSDGSLDVGKLMNSVQGMIGKMGGATTGGGGGGGMPDLSQMMSTIGPMMAGMMGGSSSSGAGGMPDLGQMMANMGPMMAGMMGGSSSASSSSGAKMTLEEDKEEKKE